MFGTQKALSVLTILTFCTWGVSVGGLASLQYSCNAGWDNAFYTIRGFSLGLGCSRFFRYYWWIIALEAVLIFGLVATHATPAYKRSRIAWAGLFAVAAMLYIQMSDSFLTLSQFVAPDEVDRIGPLGHRGRAMAAGSIMTAAMNMLIILVVGITDYDHVNTTLDGHKTVTAV